eukprot:SAG31_NODE_8787_length_1387_cov_1.850155_2_plen_210_part_00
MCFSASMVVGARVLRRGSGGWCSVSSESSSGSGTGSASSKTASSSSSETSASSSSAGTGGGGGNSFSLSVASPGADGGGGGSVRIRCLLIASLSPESSHSGPSSSPFDGIVSTLVGQMLQAGTVSSHVDPSERGHATACVRAVDCRALNELSAPATCCADRSAAQTGGPPPLRRHAPVGGESLAGTLDCTYCQQQGSQRGRGAAVLGFF